MINIQTIQLHHLTTISTNIMTSCTSSYYCNADYVAEGDRKSISAYIFTLARSPISRQAKRQTTVAQSTVEAEYATMAHAVKEIIWLEYLLQDLG